MNYHVLDRCKINSYDVDIYYFIKNNFESENIKVVLLADLSKEDFGYYIEIRKVERND